MNNLFGTDGIRGSVGTYPFIYNALTNLSHAIALWAKKKYGDDASFLIATDTRQSCSWIKSIISSSLLSHSINIYDALELPTPAVFHLIKSNQKYTCGLIISASHNIYSDNGIKLIDSQTGKLSTEDEEYISFLTENNNKNDININYKNFGVTKIESCAKESYINFIISLFKPGFLNGYKIVLDVANGATYNIAPFIFNKLGAQVIAMNNVPNGVNINQNCGAIDTQCLKQEVLKNKADFGFAFDGDGDRVIAINNSGIIKDGDDLLAILSTHPDYINSKIIASTVMANQALEVFLKNQNKKLIRTAVGDKNIVLALQENNLLLGGEQSGHIILKNIINTGDGILVALKTIEAIQYNNNINLVTFEKYPQVLLTIPITIKRDLKSSPLCELIDKNSSNLKNGRVLVRYSGTENSLRIMVEDECEEKTRATANNLAQALQQYLL